MGVRGLLFFFSFEVQHFNEFFDSLSLFFHLRVIFIFLAYLFSIFRRPNEGFTRVLLIFYFLIACVNGNSAQGKL